MKDNLEDLFNHYNTTINGLTEEEAKERLDNNTNKRKSFLIQLIKDYSFWLLLFAIIFSIFISYIKNESYLVPIILIILLIIEIFVNRKLFKEEKKLYNINEFSNQIKVFRNGEISSKSSSSIVTGDIVELEKDDVPSFDGIVLESNDFFISEDDTLLKSRKLEVKQFLYAGTLVLNGRAKILVTKTKKEIFDLRQYEQQDIIERFYQLITIIILSLIILMIIIGVINKNDFLDVLLFSITLLLAGIPKALSLLLYIISYKSMKKLKSQNIKVKSLKTISSLKNIDVLGYLVNENTFRIQFLKKDISNYNVIDKNYIEKLDDKELIKIVETYQYYSNLSLKEKIRIINCLQELGFHVGIIGYQRNDVFLKNICLLIADINCNSILKDNCDILIENTNSLNICLLEGKRLDTNIKNILHFLLCESLIEMSLILFSMIFNIELFTNIQIMWLNLIIGYSIAYFLSFENGKEEIFFKNILIKSTIRAVITALVSITLFFYFLKYHNSLIVNSLLFISLIINEFFLGFSSKNIKKSVLTKSILENQIFILGILSLIIIQGFVLITKISNYFIVSGILFHDIVLIIGINILIFLIGEFVKIILYKLKKDNMEEKNEKK